MEPYRTLALLTGSLGLVSTLVALSTNYWVVATGPHHSAHSGIWPTEGTEAAGYIHATQSFSILATLWGLVSIVILVLSFFPLLLSTPGRGPLVSAVTAFAAGLFMIVAMAVYTSERWGQVPNPQIQLLFGWSFYVGWLSILFWLSTGALSLCAHSGPRPDGYESV